MNLSDQQVQGLIEMLALTEEDEVDCGGCLQQMAEFAEATLPGATVSDSLKQIEEHLERCSDCREEFETLRDALNSELPET